MFAQNGPDHADILAGMDDAQVTAVITYLTRATENLEQRSALLRANAFRSKLRHESDPGSPHPLAPEPFPLETQGATGDHI